MGCTIGFFLSGTGRALGAKIVQTCKEQILNDHLVSSYVRQEGGKRRPWAPFARTGCLAIAINLLAVFGPNGTSWSTYLERETLTLLC